MYRQFAEYLLLLYARLNMVPAVGTVGHMPFQRWTDRKYLLLTSSTSACASLRFIRKWRWSGRNAWKGTARSALPGISMPFISSGHGAAKRVTAGNAWISSTVRWYLQRRAMPYVFAGRMRRRMEVAYQACCSTPDCSAKKVLCSRRPIMPSSLIGIMNPCICLCRRSALCKIASGISMPNSSTTSTATACAS